MSTKRVVIALTLLIVLGLPVGGGAQMTGDDSIVENEDSSALFHDASSYAEDNNTSIDEAMNRLRLQDTIGEFGESIELGEQDVFAGAWIQHNPEFKVIVLLTNGNEDTILSYATSHGLEDLIEVRSAPLSLVDLSSTREQLVQTLLNLGLVFDSDINVHLNEIEFYVLDESEFRSSLVENNLDLPDFVKIIETPELATPAVDIYAGLALRTCTSGFSIRFADSSRGVSTAGHCSNSQSRNGIHLAYIAGSTTGSLDAQVHSVTNYFTVRNWSYDGRYDTTTPYYRVITATKHRGQQMLDSYVCKYGKTTGFTCGYLISRTFQPSNPAYVNPLATYMRLHKDNTVLADQGDSGGPLFNGSTAYGLVSAVLSGDLIYMAINYIENLGVTVLVN
jgi:hypothetical protein